MSRCTNLSTLLLDDRLAAAEAHDPEGRMVACAQGIFQAFAMEDDA